MGLLATMCDCVCKCMCVCAHDLLYLLPLLFFSSVSHHQGIISIWVNTNFSEYVSRLISITSNSKHSEKASVFSLLHEIWKPNKYIFKVRSWKKKIRELDNMGYDCMRKDIYVNSWKICGVEGWEGGKKPSMEKINRSLTGSFSPFHE